MSDNDREEVPGRGFPPAKEQGGGAHSVLEGCAGPRGSSRTTTWFQAPAKPASQGCTGRLRLDMVLLRF